MRKILKRSSIFLLFAVICIGAYIIFTSGILTKSTCDVPIYYQIGTIDPQYTTTPEEFASNLLQGEAIWEGSSKKNLFENNPEKASLVINLVYDTRYELEKTADDLENRLKEENTKLSAEEEAYERDVADFNRRLSEFNNEVSSWNSRGGAPEDVLNRLVEQQQQFKTEAEELNNRAARLNRSAADYNAKIGELNANIDLLNEAYRRKPEQGIYDGVNNKIDIYLTTSYEELIHTIAHEFGHAMGIKHVNEEGAIMHAYTSENLALTQSDRNALTARCEEKYIQTLSRSYMISFLKKVAEWRLFLLRFINPFS